MKCAVAMATLLTVLVSCGDDGTNDPDPDPVLALMFVQQPGPSEASLMFTPSVSVGLIDTDGNLVTNATGTVHLALQSNTNGATLSGTSDVALIDGIATFADVTIASVGQDYILVATSDVTALAVTSQPFDVALATQFTIAVQPGSVEADGIASATVTTMLMTGGGDPIVGEPMTLQVSGSDNHVIPSAGITDSAGRWTVQIASTTAGTKMVTAHAGVYIATTSVAFVEPACVPMLPGIPVAVHGTAIHSLFASDLDGDGRQDVALVDSTMMSLQLGAGNGALRNPVRYPAGTDVRAITGGDLNGDSRTDLVTTDAAGMVRVFLGAGDGTAVAGQVISIANSPRSSAVVDVDADGRLDLVVRTQWEIVAQRGLGDGTFQHLGTYPLNAQPQSLSSTTLTVADMNGDGRADVVTGGSNSVLSVLLGNANGTFQNPIHTMSIPSRGTLAAVDFDGDTHRDVVVADSSAVTLLRGNGDGTFGTRTQIGGGLNAFAVLASDLDGDGNQDVLAVGADSSFMLLRVMHGNGNGTFDPNLDYGLNDLPGGAMVVADFNGDTRSDVVIGEGAINPRFQLSVILGAPAGTFASPTLEGRTVRFETVAGDFDGSGTLDFVATTPNTEQVGIQLAAANGALTAGPTVYAPADETLAADFNGDAKLDVLRFSGTNAHWLQGNGNGTLQPPVTSGVGLNGRLIAAELNGDGVLDLALASYGNHTLGVAFGNGDGTFDAATTYATGMNPEVLVSVDLDNDGDRDLVVSSRSTMHSVFLNNGSGSFSPGTSFSSSGLAASFATGDFNGDGNADLAIATITTSLTLRLGRGDGTFDPYVLIPGGVLTADVRAIDVDGDTFLDLVAVGVGTVVLRGKGNGTFQPARVYESGNGKLVVGDFDGDGRTEIVVPSAQGTGFSKLKNLGCL